MNNGIQHFLVALLMIAAGLSLPFAFAPYEIYPLAILAPMALGLVCLNYSSKHAFLYGFLFGCAYFGLGVYWVFHSVHVFGGVDLPVSLLITAGLIVELAFFPALTLFCTKKLNISPTYTLTLALPALWVAFEWVRSWLFTGFPWLLLGVSQTNSPLSGYAPIFSAYGVSLAILIMSGTILNATRYLQLKNYRLVYLNLIIPAGILIIGAFLSTIQWTKTSGKPLGIALVQGNIPQELKWSQDHLELSLETYRRLTEPLLENKKINMIIWPEAAVPLPFHEAEGYIQEMGLNAEKHHKAIILGIPIQVEGQNSYYNTVIALGQERPIYLKRHLVPFGEYTPFANYLNRLLAFMDIPMSDILPGAMEQKPFIVQNTEILTNICYEIAFPELIATSNPHVGFILTLTNDAWFGESSASAQHFQMAQMRAIELGRPAIMVANDGITAVIDAHGEVLAALPKRQTLVLETEIQPRTGLTPWMLFGLDPLLILILPMFFVCLRAHIVKKYEYAKEPEMINIRRNHNDVIT